MSVIITGDLLRPLKDPNKSGQTSNIVWIYNLFLSQINMIKRNEDLEVRLLLWDKKGFDTHKFYKLNNMECSLENWVKIYDNENLTKEAELYFLSFFNNSFVIGFELPQVFINLFNKHNISFIDIIIHPIRYLDDLILALRTNNQNIFGAAKKYQLSSKQFYLNASFHKAKLSRQKSLNLEKKSALFTGQIEVDKSLIKDGTCLSILSFKEELINLASQYKTIYFKRHPYSKNNNDEEEFLKQIPNIKYINNNFYQLLAQEEISSVYSISSSTVYEAKYWGKKACYLYKNPFFFSDDENQFFDKQKYIPLTHDLLLPAFWQEVLFSVIPTVSSADVPKLNMPLTNNFFRNSLNLNWGYEFLDNSLKKVNKSSTLNNKLSVRIKRFIKEIPLLGKLLVLIKHTIFK